MVPGLPWSEHAYAKSCEGPKPVEGLPADPSAGGVTAEDCFDSRGMDSSSMRSTVDKYLRREDFGAAAPGGSQSVSNPNDDAMSVSSVACSVGKKRVRADPDTASDPDIEPVVHRGRKVLRSRIIGYRWS